MVGVAFAAGAAGFLLTDGSLFCVETRAAEDWHRYAVHDGGGQALCGVGQGGFLTGGDDGRFCRTSRAGETIGLGAFGGKWVEQVAAFVGEKGKPLYACAAGRTAFVFDADGKMLKAFDHPSTVTGLAFDSKGKRLGASHYNGASLWFVNASSDSPRRLDWKGSHTGIVISPDGDNVVTAMQENALHGWRLSDGQHMRMSGYPAKSRALSFTKGGKYLASSGAEAVVMWPFFGGGPMGKQPVELAGGDNVLCSFVSSHPKQEMVAAGFSDGLVVLTDIPSQRVLPVAPATGSAVTGMAWNDEGTWLAFGREDGFAALIDCARRG